jgi:methyl-accepting chemotaxis protein
MLSNLQLKTKLFLLVAVSALGLALFALCSYLLRADNQSATQTRIYDDVNAYAVLPDLNIVVASVPVSEMLMVKDPATLQKLVERIKDAEKAYDVAEKDVLRRLPEGKTKDLVRGKTHDLAMQYYELVDTRFIPAVMQGDEQAVNDLLPELMNRYEASQVAVAEMVQADVEGGTAARAQADNAMAHSNATLIVVGVVLVVVVSLLGFLIVRSVDRGIVVMLGMIGELSSNNLAAGDAEVVSRDEIGNAILALNGLKRNLQKIMQSISDTAERVAGTSEELSSSASLQAQGAESQNNQTTQVATAMQEMSSTVLQVSENSNKAAEASRQAAETARRGGTIVEDTLNKMHSIFESVSGTAKKIEDLGKSSDQIGRIAGVIDEIADQTNLLALNAAIEAARAGEQGRGFAVVADEVRKLAERTTTATKEISQMIKSIQNETKAAVVAMEGGTRQVEDGVNATTQAGDALKEIIQMSEQVGEMITQIATAATQQSSASEEINQNMDQIAKLVKESADSAQQSANACQELSGMAIDLKKMVSNFHLSNGAGSDRRHLGRRSTTNRARTLAAHAG